MKKNLSLRKRTALELNRRIRKNKVYLHELRVLFWECTLRCNISCRHCGSDCRVVANQSDMPMEDFLKVIDSITPFVNPNKVLITFTGGEALVRKDIEVCGLELYRRSDYCLRAGRRIHLRLSEHPRQLPSREYLQG